MNKFKLINFYKTIVVLLFALNLQFMLFIKLPNKLWSGCSLHNRVVKGNQRIERIGFFQRMLRVWHIA